MSLPLPAHRADKKQPSLGVVTGISQVFRRVSRRTTLLLLLTICVVYYWYSWPESMEVYDPDKPPLYGDYHQRELALPQHNADLPYPEGRQGKYVWFANRVNGVGWGNALQEFLLNSYLAHEAGFSHVFDNYTWDRYGEDYTNFKGRGKFPSRIPYSVMVEGPLVGAPWPKGDAAPRAVIKEYWDEVCPTKTVVNPRDIDGSWGNEISALDLVDRWVAALRSLGIKDHCIEFKEDEMQLFSFWVFGNGKRLLPLWPKFSKSPIITQFRWSKLIEYAVRKNLNLLTDTWVPSLIFDYPYKPIPGLLALHIRRGDFDEACGRLADWASEYNAYNTFPELPDKLVPPEGSGWGSSTPQAREIYWKHCLPTIDQIVERVEEIRKTKEGEGLRNIFIMTNGDKTFIQELTTALRKASNWNMISSSRDVRLNWEQKFVAQAVDMLIGQRAQVIIGNGWSSLTSNVVMFRMANNVLPAASRFW
ncbi:hypothetical protein C8Q75DRAFT_765893 [Abortiporus biennis]|nr:hypothetical protein C8Q75DRAFT_765893 [Abortiporus biennis]